MNSPSLKRPFKKAWLSSVSSRLRRNTAVSFWIALALCSQSAWAEPLSCRVLVDQAVSGQSVAGQVAAPTAEVAKNARRPVLFLKNETRPVSKETSITQMAAAALQVALRDTQGGQPKLAKPLFALNEKLLASLRADPSTRKNEIVNKAKSRWGPNDSTYASALKEFRLGYVSKKDDSFSYLRNNIVEGIILNIVKRGLDSGRIQFADLFSSEKMASFFKGYSDRQGINDSEILWEKLDNYLGPEWKESFTISATEAATVAVQSVVRIQSENRLQSLAEERLRELVQVFEANPSGINAQNLQLARQRLAKVSGMSLFEFVDAYFGNPKNYFDLFFLPIHGSLEKIMADAKWETRAAPLKSVRLADLKALLQKLRPEPTYRPKDVNWTNGNQLLVATEQLGESMAVVRRALLGKEKRPVVYKAYTTERNFGVATYEYYFAEYATQARSFRMARVLFHDPASGALVKDYVHGLTYRELVQHYGENSAEFSELVAALNTEMAIVGHATAGFDHWLQLKDPKAYQRLHEAYPGLMGSTDTHKADNWLFDPQQGRWILHDP